MPDSRFQPIYFHYENVRNGRLPGTRYLLLPVRKDRQKISEFTQKSLDGDFANRQQSFGLLSIGKQGNVSASPAFAEDSASRCEEMQPPPEQLTKGSQAIGCNGRSVL
jgi:hypothetical protein